MGSWEFVTLPAILVYEIISLPQASINKMSYIVIIRIMMRVNVMLFSLRLYVYMSISLILRSKKNFNKYFLFFFFNHWSGQLSVSIKPTCFTYYSVCVCMCCIFKFMYFLMFLPVKWKTILKLMANDSSMDLYKRLYPVFWFVGFGDFFFFFFFSTCCFFFNKCRLLEPPCPLPKPVSHAAASIVSKLPSSNPQKNPSLPWPFPTFF